MFRLDIMIRDSFACNQLLDADYLRNLFKKQKLLLIYVENQRNKYLIGQLKLSKNVRKNDFMIRFWLAVPSNARSLLIGPLYHWISDQIYFIIVARVVKKSVTMS